jgi:hypothetical protein
MTIGSAPAARAERRATSPIGPAPLQDDHGSLLLFDGTNGDIPDENGISETKSSTFDTC